VSHEYACVYLCVTVSSHIGSNQLDHRRSSQENSKDDRKG